MKLLRDCLILAAAAGAVYYYKRSRTPPPAPEKAYVGARPNLDIPARARGLRPAPPESAMLVTPEKRLERAPALGSTPGLFARDRPDTPAAEPSKALAAERSGWWDRLYDPRLVGAIPVLFLVLWSLLTRLLRRGPGGRGFTHD